MTGWDVVICFMLLVVAYCLGFSDGKDDQKMEELLRDFYRAKRAKDLEGKR
jgi:hypothetical protein